MTEEYILVVDDNENQCNIIYERLKERHGDKYSIARFLDAKDACEFIDLYIDRDDNTLALVATDERLKGSSSGHTFLEELCKTHPRAKTLLFSAYSDAPALISGIHSHIDAFIPKARNGTAGDDFFNLVQRLLEEHESQPRLNYSISGITFKQADTLHDKLAFLRKRHDIYLQVGHKTKTMLRPEEAELGMEWDEYDHGGIESIVLNPKTRYLVAMKHGECLGGVRIIDGKCPMESGLCLCDGYGFKKGQTFTLDHLRSKDIYTREVSRLIVDRKYRSSVVLIGIFRLIEQLTSEQNTLVCTAKEEQVRLYRAIGFEDIGPKIQYSLSGEWIPLMRDRWKTYNEPHLIQGMSESFHLKCTQPLPFSDVERWNSYSQTVTSEAIRMGLYLDANSR